MRKCTIGVLLTVIIWLHALPYADSRAQNQDHSDWSWHRMIAHAMGGIGGVDYTNSYEAFIVNYEKGHRVFEVDLILTEDGYLAARHDWHPYMATLLQQDIPADRLGASLTLTEFKSLPILHKYQPLSFEDIVDLARRYPDVYFVTDTKETDLAQIRKQFVMIKETAEAADASVLTRIVPEIYTQQMYEAVMDIYPFPGKLYSLYLSSEPQEETLAFVKEKGIRTVAMPMERAMAMPGLVTKLLDAGVRTYVHTVNTAEEMQTVTKLGVYGVYTDFLSADNEREAVMAQQAAALFTANSSNRTTAVNSADGREERWVRLLESH